MPASPTPFKNDPLELVLYWMSKLENLEFGKVRKKQEDFVKETPALT